MPEPTEEDFAQAQGRFGRVASTSNPVGDCDAGCPADLMRDDQLRRDYVRTDGHCQLCGLRLAFRNYGRYGARGMQS